MSCNSRGPPTSSLQADFPLPPPKKKPRERHPTHFPLRLFGPSLPIPQPLQPLAEREPLFKIHETAASSKLIAKAPSPPEAGQGALHTRRHTPSGQASTGRVSTGHGLSMEPAHTFSCKPEGSRGQHRGLSSPPGASQPRRGGPFCGEPVELPAPGCLPDQWLLVLKSIPGCPFLGSCHRGAGRASA